MAVHLKRSDPLRDRREAPTHSRALSGRRCLERDQPSC